MMARVFPKSKLKVERPSTVTDAEAELVVDFARDCLTELRNPKYELPKIDRPMRVAIHTKRGSWGGTSGISIGIAWHRYRFEVLNEYANHRACRVIGSIKGHRDWLVRSAVAHEVAHFIQHEYVDEMTANQRKLMHRPHGEGWRRVYSWLRRELVNEHVKPWTGHPLWWQRNEDAPDEVQVVSEIKSGVYRPTSKGETRALLRLGVAS